jgi:predicted PurR-regulated permease PerM
MERTNRYFRNQLLFWAATFLLLFLFVWVFKSILLPFVLGIVVAYLLNPIVNKLGTYGLNRTLAALTILSCFILALLLLLALTIPVLYRELSSLIQDMPQLYDRVMAYIQPYISQAQNALGVGRADPMAVLKENAEGALSAGKTILSGLAAGGAFLTSLLTVIVIMPIVAFFMMQEWPDILKRVRNLLPREHKDTILDLLAKMDKKMAGFIRGQLTVAFILGISYAISLSLAGLNYGFLIGIGAGLFSIIPMVGSTLGLLVAVLVAWLQSGDITFVAIIAGIFLLGQLIEGNFLSPKLIGDSVGLHPLWVFFALMAGGALFGIVGMLIAVPITAVISVLAAFMIEQYKQSHYYLGTPEDIEVICVTDSGASFNAPEGDIVRDDDGQSQNS